MTSTARTLDPMATEPAGSSTPAAPEQDAPLRRAASRLYRDHVKPALKRGLLDVRPHATFDKNAYVVDVADNLLPGLCLREIEREFGAGAGGELRGEMRAPGSSSALAVSSFLPWRTHGNAVPVFSLGPFASPFEFEAKCPNGVSRISPHLDVLFETDHKIVGIEAKCTEFVQGSAHTPVSEGYRGLETANDPRAASLWFGALASTEDFALLDSYQLIKHYLGLRNMYPDRDLTLVYLYWEPTNAATEHVFRAHRREVARFAYLVAGDMTCRFVHGSYAELWRQWSSIAEAPAWLPVHMELLQRRYLVEI